MLFLSNIILGLFSLLFPTFLQTFPTSDKNFSGRKNVMKFQSQPAAFTSIARQIFVRFFWHC